MSQIVLDLYPTNYIVMLNFLKNLLAYRQIEAIRVLSEQIVFDAKGEPIIDRYHYEDWQQLTAVYIEKFLGRDSALYKDFIAIKLLQAPIQTQPDAQTLSLERWELTKAHSTLLNCITYIAKFKYLYRKPSLFGLLPITGQVSLAIFGATLFFYIGRFTVVEKQTFESELKDCKKTVALLQERCDSLTLLIPVSRAKTPAEDSTEHQPKKKN